jgi:predicted permease
MLKFLRRIGYALSSRRRHGELAAELEFHRAERQSQLERSGVPASEARTASVRALGNLTLAQEDARQVWVAAWAESIWQDAGYALRVVRRDPGFAAAMIVVLALGIGATTAVVNLLDALVVRSLPVRDPERLVYFSKPSFSYPVFEDLQARGSSIFTRLVAWNFERENIEWATEIEPAEVLMASGDFYSMLGIRAALGRTFSAEDDVIGGGASGLVALISEAAWQSRFGGSPDVIGRTVRIRRRPFTIVGVTPAGFFGVAPGLAPEITIPLTTLQDEETLQSRTDSWVHLMGRLHDGLALDRANVWLQTVWPAVLAATAAPGMRADRVAAYAARTTSLESARTGYSRVRNQFEEPLWVLLALVALLLTVSTASAANLLLARGAARHREFSVRLAIGAGRWRVVRQIVVEALVWTLLGSAVGLTVGVWSSATLVTMMSTWENPITIETGLTWRTGSIALALSLALAVVCAIVPAIRATGLNIGAAIKACAPVEGATARRWSLGPLLVVSQVGVTVLLLFGAALFARSLNRIVGQDVGFERKPILIVAADASAAGYAGARHAAFYTELHRRLSAIPGVESASLSQYPPISDEDGAWTENIGIDGKAVEQDEAREVYLNGVTPDYFRTMGIRVLQGRGFTGGDHGSSRREVIVNEWLARTFFPGENPVGRKVTIGRHAFGRDLEVVGVVTAPKYQHLTEASRSVVFLPRSQLADVLDGENLVAEVRVAGPLPAAAEHVRREIRALDASMPIRIQALTDRIRASLARERVIAALATTLGLTALALACAGLYGLLAYTVSRQTREIGVRVALGASRGRMRRMVLRRSVRLGLAGISVGIAASLAFGEFARNLLFEVSETDPFALAAAAGLMLVVAIGAGYLPARRAARVDPIVALRAE